ncbi:MAG: inverse autotransporter beta domain-containing protein [Gammaproteobacteria bacterium]
MRRVRGAAFWAACGTAVLSVGGLSADSRLAGSADGGFLYSEYLRESAGGGKEVGGGGFVAGSFVVDSGRSVLWADGRRVADKVGEAIDGLPLRTWLMDYYLAENADISSRWRESVARTGWDLAALAVDETVMAATAGAARRGFIRNIEVDLQSELGGRFAQAGLNVLGAFRETADDALAWQLRGYAGSGRQGGNAGLIYRRAAGGNLLGVNIFTDYETYEDEGFWRWSAGGEARSPWLDLFANYYVPLSDDLIRDTADGGRTATYTAGGYDLELNVHSPKHPWLVGVAEYFVWEGEHGREDDEGYRAGFRIQPRTAPIIWELTYQEGEDGDQIGGRVSYLHKFGAEYAGGRSPEFNARDWFFAPVQREYSQRIYTQDITAPGSIHRLVGIVSADSAETLGGAVVLLDLPTAAGAAANSPLTSLQITTETGGAFSAVNSLSLLSVVLSGTLSGASVSERVEELPYRLPLLSATLQTDNSRAVLEYGNDGDASFGTVRLGSTAYINQLTISLIHGTLSVAASGTLDVETNDTTLRLAAGAAAVFQLIEMTTDAAALATVILISSSADDAVQVETVNGVESFNCDTPVTPGSQLQRDCLLEPLVLALNNSYAPPSGASTLTAGISVNRINVGYREETAPDISATLASVQIFGGDGSATLSVVGTTPQTLSFDTDTGGLMLAGTFPTGTNLATVTATLTVAAMETVTVDPQTVSLILTVAVGQFPITPIGATFTDGAPPGGNLLGNPYGITGFVGASSTLASIRPTGGVGNDDAANYTYTLDETDGNKSSQLTVDSDGAIILEDADSDGDDAPDAYARDQILSIAVAVNDLASLPSDERTAPVTLSLFVSVVVINTPTVTADVASTLAAGDGSAALPYQVDRSDGELATFTPRGGNVSGYEFTLESGGNRNAFALMTTNNPTAQEGATLRFADDVLPTSDGIYEARVRVHEPSASNDNASVITLRFMVDAPEDALAAFLAVNSDYDDAGLSVTRVNNTRVRVGYLETRAPATGTHFAVLTIEGGSGGGVRTLEGTAPADHPLIFNAGNGQLRLAANVYAAEVTVDSASLTVQVADTAIGQTLTVTAAVTVVGEALSSLTAGFASSFSGSGATSGNPLRVTGNFTVDVTVATVQVGGGDEDYSYTFDTFANSGLTFITTSREVILPQRTAAHYAGEEFAIEITVMDGHDSGTPEVSLTLYVSVVAIDYDDLELTFASELLVGSGVQNDPYETNRRRENLATFTPRGGSGTYTYSVNDPPFEIDNNGILGFTGDELPTPPRVYIASVTVTSTDGNGATIETATERVYVDIGVAPVLDAELAIVGGYNNDAAAARISVTRTAGGGLHILMHEALSFPIPNPALSVFATLLLDPDEATAEGTVVVNVDSAAGEEVVDFDGTDGMNPGEGVAISFALNTDNSFYADGAAAAGETRTVTVTVDSDHDDVQVQNVYTIDISVAAIPPVVFDVSGDAGIPQGGAPNTDPHPVDGFMEESRTLAILSASGGVGEDAALGTGYTFNVAEYFNADGSITPVRLMLEDRGDGTAAIVLVDQNTGGYTTTSTNSRFGFDIRVNDVGTYADRTEVTAFVVWVRVTNIIAPPLVANVTAIGNFILGGAGSETDPFLLAEGEVGDGTQPIAGVDANGGSGGPIAVDIFGDPGIFSLEDISGGAAGRGIHWTAPDAGLYILTLSLSEASVDDILTTVYFRVNPPLAVELRSSLGRETATASTLFILTSDIAADAGVATLAASGGDGTTYTFAVDTEDGDLQLDVAAGVISFDRAQTAIGNHVITVDVSSGGQVGTFSVEISAVSALSSSITVNATVELDTSGDDDLYVYDYATREPLTGDSVLTIVAQGDGIAGDAPYTYERIGADAGLRVESANNAAIDGNQGVVEFSRLPFGGSRQTITVRVTGLSGQTLDVTVTVSNNGLPPENEAVPSLIYRTQNRYFGSQAESIQLTVQNAGNFAQSQETESCLPASSVLCDTYEFIDQNTDERLQAVAGSFAEGTFSFANLNRFRGDTPSNERVTVRIRGFDESGSDTLEFGTVAVTLDVFDARLDGHGNDEGEFGKDGASDFRAYDYGGVLTVTGDVDLPVSATVLGTFYLDAVGGESRLSVHIEDGGILELTTADSGATVLQFAGFAEADVRTVADIAGNFRTTISIFGDGDDPGSLAQDDATSAPISPASVFVTVSRLVCARTFDVDSTNLDDLFGNGGISTVYLHDFENRRYLTQDAGARTFSSSPPEDGGADPDPVSGRALQKGDIITAAPDGTADPLTGVQGIAHAFRVFNAGGGGALNVVREVLEPECSTTDLAANVLDGGGGNAFMDAEWNIVSDGDRLAAALRYTGRPYFRPLGPLAAVLQPALDDGTPPTALSGDGTAANDPLLITSDLTDAQNAVATLSLGGGTGAYELTILNDETELGIGTSGSERAIFFLVTQTVNASHSLTVRIVSGSEDENAPIEFEVYISVQVSPLEADLQPAAGGTGTGTSGDPFLISGNDAAAGDVAASVAVLGGGGADARTFTRVGNSADLSVSADGEIEFAADRDGLLDLIITVRIAGAPGVALVSVTANFRVLEALRVAAASDTYAGSGTEGDPFVVPYTPQEFISLEALRNSILATVVLSGGTPSYTYAESTTVEVDPTVFVTTFTRDGDTFISSITAYIGDENDGDFDITPRADGAGVEVRREDLFAFFIGVTMFEMSLSDDGIDEMLHSVYFDFRPPQVRAEIVPSGGRDGSAANPLLIPARDAAFGAAVATIQADGALYFGERAVGERTGGVVTYPPNDLLGPFNPSVIVGGITITNILPAEEMPVQFADAVLLEDPDTVNPLVVGADGIVYLRLAGTQGDEVADADAETVYTLTVAAGWGAAYYGLSLSVANGLASIFTSVRTETNGDKTTLTIYVPRLGELRDLVTLHLQIDESDGVCVASAADFVVPVVAADDIPRNPTASTARYYVDDGSDGAATVTFDFRRAGPPDSPGNYTRFLLHYREEFGGWYYNAARISEGVFGGPRALTGGERVVQFTEPFNANAGGTPAATLTVFIDENAARAGEAEYLYFGRRVAAGGCTPADGNFAYFTGFADGTTGGGAGVTLISEFDGDGTLENPFLVPFNVARDLMAVAEIFPAVGGGEINSYTITVVGDEEELRYNTTNVGQSGGNVVTREELRMSIRTPAGEYAVTLRVDAGGDSVLLTAYARVLPDFGGPLTASVVTELPILSDGAIAAGVDDHNMDGAVFAYVQASGGDGTYTYSRVGSPHLNLIVGEQTTGRDGGANIGWVQAQDQYNGNRLIASVTVFYSGQHTITVRVQSGSEFVSITVAVNADGDLPRVAGVYSPFIDDELDGGDRGAGPVIGLTPDNPVRVAAEVVADGTSFGVPGAGRHIAVLRLESYFSVNDVTVEVLNDNTKNSPRDFRADIGAAPLEFVRTTRQIPPLFNRFPIDIEARRITIHAITVLIRDDGGNQNSLQPNGDYDFTVRIMRGGETASVTVYTRFYSRAELSATVLSEFPTLAARLPAADGGEFAGETTDVLRVPIARVLHGAFIATISTSGGADPVTLSTSEELVLGARLSPEFSGRLAKIRFNSPPLPGIYARTVNINGAGRDGGGPDEFGFNDAGLNTTVRVDVYAPGTAAASESPLAGDGSDNSPYEIAAASAFADAPLATLFAAEGLYTADSCAISGSSSDLQISPDCVVSFADFRGGNAADYDITAQVNFQGEEVLHTVYVRVVVDAGAPVCVATTENLVLPIVQTIPSDTLGSIRYRVDPDSLSANTGDGGPVVDADFASGGLYAVFYVDEEMAGGDNLGTGDGQIAGSNTLTVGWYYSYHDSSQTESFGAFPSIELGGSQAAPLPPLARILEYRGPIGAATATATLTVFVDDSLPQDDRGRVYFGVEVAAGSRCQSDDLVPYLDSDAGTTDGGGVSVPDPLSTEIVSQFHGGGPVSPSLPIRIPLSQAGGNLATLLVSGGESPYNITHLSTQSESDGNANDLNIRNITADRVVVGFSSASRARAGGNFSAYEIVDAASVTLRATIHLHLFSPPTAATVAELQTYSGATISLHFPRNLHTITITGPTFADRVFLQTITLNPHNRGVDIGDNNPNRFRIVTATVIVPRLDAGFAATLTFRTNPSVGLTITAPLAAAAAGVPLATLRGGDFSVEYFLGEDRDPPHPRQTTTGDESVISFDPSQVPPSPSPSPSPGEERQLSFAEQVGARGYRASVGFNFADGENYSFPADIHLVVRNTALRGVTVVSPYHNHATGGLAEFDRIVVPYADARSGLAILTVRADLDVYDNNAVFALNNSITGGGEGDISPRVGAIGQADGNAVEVEIGFTDPSEVPEAGEYFFAVPLDAGDGTATMTVYLQVQEDPGTFALGGITSPFFESGQVGLSPGNPIQFPRFVARTETGFNALPGQGPPLITIALSGGTPPYAIDLSVRANTFPQDCLEPRVTEALRPAGLSGGQVIAHPIEGAAAIVLEHTCPNSSFGVTGKYTVDVEALDASFTFVTFALYYEVTNFAGSSRPPLTGPIDSQFIDSATADGTEGLNSNPIEVPLSMVSGPDGINVPIFRIAPTGGYGGYRFSLTDGTFFDPTTPFKVDPTYGIVSFKEPHTAAGLMNLTVRVVSRAGYQSTGPDVISVNVYVRIVDDSAELTPIHFPGDEGDSVDDFSDGIVLASRDGGLRRQESADADLFLSLSDSANLRRRRESFRRFGDKRRPPGS